MMFLCKPSMGLTPLKLYGVISNYAIWNYNSLRPFDFNAEDISDCQIIGRRIKDMTDGERNIHAELMNQVKAPFLQNEESFESINYLLDIGVFPDKYFDELKWCEEEK